MLIFLDFFGVPEFDHISVLYTIFYKNETGYGSASDTPKKLAHGGQSGLVFFCLHVYLSQRVIVS